MRELHRHSHAASPASIGLSGSIHSLGLVSTAPLEGDGQQHGEEREEHSPAVVGAIANCGQSGVGDQSADQHEGT